MLENAFFAMTVALFGGFGAREALRTLRRSARAEGRVVDTKRGEDTDWPVIEFGGPGGQIVRYTDGLPSWRAPAVGEPVRVRYRPDAPGDATIDGFRHSWGMILWIVVFILAIVTIPLSATASLSLWGATLVLSFVLP